MKNNLPMSIVPSQSFSGGFFWSRWKISNLAFASVGKHFYSSTRKNLKKTTKTKQYTQKNTINFYVFLIWLNINFVYCFIITIFFYLQLAICISINIALYYEEKPKFIDWHLVKIVVFYQVIKQFFFLSLDEIFYSFHLPLYFF